MLKILHGDYRKFMDYEAPLLTKVDTIFADPPDNIDLGYDEYDDSISDWEYYHFLSNLIHYCVPLANTIYFSINAKHINKMSLAIENTRERYKRLLEGIEDRWLIQGFTFGQHNKHDFGNNFRPILRLRKKDAPLFPDQTRIESDRMKQGDKRANPEGRVPGDTWRSDFLEYARVTGNSKQRRAWHPTQLNEGVVEDCLLMSTPPGGTVIDPFCGTGTTLRVCKANGWSCSTMDVSYDYCSKVACEHNLPEVAEGIWYG